MCEVTAIVTTALAAAGTVMNAAQQSQQAAAQQNALNYQAVLARNEATALEYNAQTAEREGEVEEDRQRRAAALRIASLTARLAGSGSTLAGTPTDLIGDAGGLAEEDALGIRYRATSRARDWRLQAANRMTQASLYADKAAGINTSLFKVTDLFGKSLLGGATPAPIGPANPGSYVKPLDPGGGPAGPMPAISPGGMPSW
jgi:hypothetical protein